MSRKIEWEKNSSFENIFYFIDTEIYTRKKARVKLVR